MQYVERALERKFLRMAGFFKVLLVTGARQVGKTTMLRHLAEGTERTYVTMDRQEVRALAQRDPALFFQTYQPPILIDEIQKAPELLEEIKVRVDASEAPGQFWLTGSQQFSMMERVQETLAGRVGILHLYPLSLQEKLGEIDVAAPDFSFAAVQEAAKHRKPLAAPEVFRDIWCGGMPGIQQADDELREEYFSSYTETYLLRDAVDAGGVKDTERFLRFLRACAAIAGGQVNYATLAEAADISQPTAKAWLNLLAGLGVLYLLPPFANNELKRLAKTPKLYFCDTGLCAYLSYWFTPETLMMGAASGRYYENYVIMELVKRYAASTGKANFCYYRDRRKEEIDLVIETNGELHPLEIKKSATPDVKETKKFALLKSETLKRGAGGIVCLAEEVLPIDAMDSILPSWAL